MITLRGFINDQRQPTVPITIRGVRNKEQTVQAMLDTSFNGMVALPPELVLELGLAFWFIRTVTLADGSTQDISNHHGRVLWEGFERPVRVSASGNQPLLGMGLLVG